MENQDIELAVLIADQTNTLLENVTGKTTEEAESFVEKWIGAVQQIINQFGISKEVKLIKEQFNLSNDMIALLCLTALPAINSKFASFYTTLNGESKSVSPKISVLLNLITPTFSHKSTLLADLRNNNSLLYWELLVRNNENNFLESTLKPSKVLTNFLNGSYGNEDGVTGIYSIVDHVKLDLSFDEIKLLPEKQIISIQGGFDERQLSYALKLSKLFGQQLFQLNTKILLSSKTSLASLKSVLLAVALKKGVIYWQNGIQILKENPDFIPLINAWIDLKHTKLIYGEENFIALPKTINNDKVNVLKLAPLTRSMDEEVWKDMGQKYIQGTEVNWKLINNTYYLHFPRLKETFNLLKQRKENGKVITTSIFQEAYKNTSPKKLTELAYLDHAKFTFDEMVLSEDVQEKINALEATFSKRILINNDKPTGVCAVFEGPTGCGKTMAAEALANKLGLPLYRVDYALLADKIADVENNLSMVFRLAELNSAALLFDDADALFAKGAIGDDSKSDLINGFLVQKIQDFGSLLILTTSKKEKIAPSFFQKVTTQVAFKALNPQQRYDVMKMVLKKYGVTVDKGVKLKNLAASFHLNGNTINRLMKNAVLSASTGKESLEKVVLKTENLAKAIKLEQS